MPSASGQTNGLVRSVVGGAYEVELHQGGGSSVVEASLRGRLKREQRTGDAVVVGDRVVVEAQPEGGYTIEAVAERSSQLARRAPGRGRHRGAKVLVANLDQLVVVFAVAEPPPRLRMVDRFLVLAEASDVAALIVVNKTDRVGAADAESAFGVYASIGYPIVYTSARTGAGVQELERRLCGRISALAGPSGVGKSSLLNAIQPGLRLRTGVVSRAVRKGGKGRHTTVSSRLIPLECGGYVADTPGLRELGLWGITPDELDRCFPEFAGYLGECQFAGSCTHTHEPGCAVRQAVENGRIPGERYESYVALRDADD